MSAPSSLYNTSNQRQNAAVIRFADWLTNLTVQREVAYGVGGGAGKAKIVLCGHRYVYNNCPPCNTILNALSSLQYGRITRS